MGRVFCNLAEVILKSNTRYNRENRRIVLNLENRNNRRIGRIVLVLIVLSGKSENGSGSRTNSRVVTKYIFS